MPSRPPIELRWPGKDAAAAPPPQRLVEDPRHSYPPLSATSKPSEADNRLIEGDCLAALQALEPELAGKVQCVYIDPPYNTGRRLAHYPDDVDSSRWLSMMHDRLRLLYRLLHDSGTLFVHVDDNELGSLMAMGDELFGARNRIALITFKQSSVSGPKAVNPGFVSIASYLVVYAKQRPLWRPNKLYAATVRDRRYSRFVENPEQPPDKWRLIPLRVAFGRTLGKKESLRRADRDKLAAELDSFVLAHAGQVVRTARIAAKDLAEAQRPLLAASAAEPERVFFVPRPTRGDLYFLRGEQLLFYSTKVHQVDGQRVSGQALSTIWDDLLSNNLHKEGGVDFRLGKKPELLLKRCLEVATAPGDLVLDAFAGSGTTAAVAHKLGRRWIAVELGPQAQSHCLPRLRAVVDGRDPSGATVAAGWSGGGSFRYFRLEPAAGAQEPTPPAKPSD